MLRIGLTGGIGAGKSTVSRTLAECGAFIVDSDVIAREVVEPGTPGLTALVEAFGESILRPDGALDRPALAAIAFQDDTHRATLNGIVHPLVGSRRAELMAAAGEDAIVVEDIPLLTENSLAPFYHLVLVVHAEIETRVTRLITHRGMDEQDARSRVAAQASDEQRRAIADVWLDNSGDTDALAQTVRDLWAVRLLPYEINLRTRQHVRADPVLAPADPTWPAQAQRIINRLAVACGSKALRIDHIGSTAVPGLEAKDVIDIQVTVESLEVADALAGSLADIGLPRLDRITGDNPHAGDGARWGKRFHASADPGRLAHVHLRVDGWPGQRYALIFRDWLRADPQVRGEYLEVKRLAERTAQESPQDTAAYVEAKEPWFAQAYPRALAWADETGWTPAAS
ncbi:dephospho-CoA kinase [Mycobacteroides chelonae]|jgi:dephospho-CoA kinase|uniref:Dephospho-CoA kinase n=1 Tax=Mycobacteroides chelonae TaxID=1774 RepID=A0AB73U1D2_MYCCH|nr:MULTISPECIES: dephospho-CoA kinase [Mycobacteroides]KRQ17967.1 dephospho-CoA kinase [Mycobacteroides sp. H072]KRQ39591.1 dephospho-CoA kinase [Mycobacteroides sp. H002]KRQ54262.1 dephospho-CoA kinase [Mycobacteroides sp. H054]KRQ66386.1 dephospho-CoA kinase [Mycobacteroides sp. H001]MBF9315929.1 dephospho-CoA kinase [Mycobacteroides chelonae]